MGELTRLERLLPQIQQTSEESLRPEFYLSLYRDLPPARGDEIANECSRIQAAFPQLPPTFFLILTQRIVEKKIPIRQITDAVNNLIDNFRFPTPTIADIIGFDKKVKLFSHAEVVAMLPKGYEFTDFEKIELNGKIRWTLK
jgi:hypothetical protein